MKPSTTELSPPATKKLEQRPKSKANTNSIINSSLPDFKMYLKQFPLTLPSSITKALENFEALNSEFVANLSNLKLYRIQLANLFEANWLDFMQLLKTIVLKFTKQIEKQAELKKTELNKLLQLGFQSQKQTLKLQEQLQRLNNLRQLQKTQLESANAEIQTMNREMSDIYDILRRDMDKILKYLVSVEQSKEKQTKQASTTIYLSLQKLNDLITKIETEHSDTSSSLSTMNQIIKAMARTTKTTTCTQVDQTQLLIPAQKVFGDEMPRLQEYSYDVLEASAVGCLSKAKFDHLIDKLKMKEREVGFDISYPLGGVERPWALTPTLFTFLESMAKENESGRVMPWEYMKTLISDIYQERVRCSHEAVLGMVGNSMFFDEFVVCDFLKTYRIR